MLSVNNLIGFGSISSTPPMAIVSYSTYAPNVSQSTHIIPAPSNILSGDILLVCLNMASGSALTYTMPSGWVETSDSNQRAIGYKIATGSEPSSYSFFSSAAGYITASIICIRYANYDTVGTISTAVKDAVAPSITVANKSFAFLVITQSNGTAVAAGSATGWTNVVPGFGNARGDNLSHYMTILYKYYDTSQATGNITTSTTYISRAQLVSTTQQ